MFIVFSLIFSFSSVFYVKHLKAQNATEPTQQQVLKAVTEQKVEQKKQGKESKFFNKLKLKYEAWKKSFQETWKNKDIVAKRAFKASLHTLLNNLAKGTAEWLVAGDVGQKPMWDTRSLEKVLTDSADQAAGEFIEQLGKQGAECRWAETYEEDTYETRYSGSKTRPKGLSKEDWNLTNSDRCGGEETRPDYNPEDPIFGGKYACFCKSGWPIAFNLCEPDFEVKMDIGLGLAKESNLATKKTSCTWSEMKKNWSEEINDPDFLDKFQASLNPWETDVGVAFALHTNILKEAVKEEELAQEKRMLEGMTGGLKDFTDKISGWVMTPAGLVLEQAKEGTIKKGTKAEETYTGDIVADAIGTFVDTLAGKLMTRLFKEGLALLNGQEEKSAGGGEGYGYESYSGGYGSSGLYSYEGEVGYGGIAAAQLRFADFVEAGFITGGPYEILQKLAMCPDLNNPGPTDCVIDERFRHAIENKTQVKDLDPDILQRPFGVSSRRSDTGEVLEPSYKEGFPLRSLVILRKYRIIPVGWELAAQYISRFDDKIYNLGDLVKASNDSASPFFGLIEPNWVLKAPENYCRRQGPGPTINSADLVAGYDTNEDGDYEDVGDTPPYVSLSRDDNYCADEQTCIVENDDGSCRFYGYCTEEKRVWNFGADNCASDFNTCQTFTGRNGVTASYLKNSLNYNGCNIDNVGCWWFCQDYDTVSGNWACASPGKSYKKCDQPTGCTIKRECDIPLGSNQCYAEQDGILIVSTVTCNSTWTKTNNNKVCRFTVEGDIPYGATQTTIPACSGAGNLLNNSGFEDGTGYNASEWEEYTGSNNAYHRRLKKTEAHAGSYLLESYTDLSPGEMVTKSNEIKVTAGNTYIISGWIYNNLNLGEVEIYLGHFNKNNTYTLEYLNSAGKCSGVPAKGSKYWSQFFCKFNAKTDLARVGLVTRDYVDKEEKKFSLNGTVWFDEIKLQKNCLGQAVTIYNGNKPESYIVDNQGNDIYLDGQAESCSAAADGCSELIRVQAGLAANLVKNGNFDDYEGTPDDEIADIINNYGWQVSAPATLFISSESLFGKTAVKMGSGELSQDIDLGVSPAGKILSFSFWSKLINSSQSGQVDFAIKSSCGQTMETSSTNKTVTANWQEFYQAVILDENCQDNLITINIKSETGVLVDGVQLEELSKNQLESGLYYSSYNDYGSANQVYLKAPPAYYGCQGYTVSRPYGSKLEIKRTDCTGNDKIWWNSACYEAKVDGIINNKTTCQNQKNRAWLGTNENSVSGASNDSKCLMIDDANCSQFAQMCFEDEISCRWYTPLNGGPKVPGVAKYPDDYCPAECVGYQTYKQEPTYFELDGIFPLYFISTTARKCSAQQAGCDEFTNLDEVAKGGEGREYYTYLRQCQKPAPENSDCTTYYTWMGSDVNGYQLQVYQLKKSNLNNGQAPCTNLRYDDGKAICGDGLLGAKIAECYKDDTLTDPDCREFYDTNGNISYRLYSRTVTCSEDCHPYRKTAVAKQNYCQGSGGYWNANNECIYYAIPKEGVKCSANAAGCRAYTGNAGKNVANVLFDTFEGGTSQNWQTNGSLEYSNEAVNVGGHSLHIKKVDKGSGSARKEVSELVTADKAYLLEFWAKGDGDTALLPVLGQFYQGNWEPVVDSYQPFNELYLSLDNQWRHYSVGPIFTDWQFATGDDISTYLGFFLKTGNGYYLDNIILKEVTDNIFVIRDSWQTPVTCDNDYFDPIGNYCQGGDVPNPNYPRCLPQAMLGCEGYRDSNNQTLYLKSFDHLCREEAVGCEIMINTYNSATPFEKNWHQGDASAATVPADKTILLVNDSSKSCQPEDKGCLGMGRPVLDQNNKVTSIQSVYLKNNPDQYDNIMCLASEVGCDEYITGASSYYFKDPLNKVCDFRAAAGENRKIWHKRGSDEQCPVVTSQLGIEYPAGVCVNSEPPRICSKATEISDCHSYEYCAAGGFCTNKNSCLTDDDCRDNTDLTTKEATKNNYCSRWAGICPASQSGCTEFIDPISPFAKNLVFNGGFEQNTEDESWKNEEYNNFEIPDGWIDRGMDNRETESAAAALREYKYDESRKGMAVRVGFGGGVKSGVQNFYQKNFLLEPNTLYTLSAYIKKESDAEHAVVGLYNCSSSNKQNKPKGVNSPDSSMIVAEQQSDAINWYNHVYFLVGNNKLDGNQDKTKREYRLFSGRFFSGDLVSCEGLAFGSIRADLKNPATGGHWFDDISLRKAGIYYKINSSKIDKTSCNGRVDFNLGCVLFNDRGAINWQRGEGNNDYLIFDADQSPNDKGIPKSNCDSAPNDNYSEECDANTLLKVKPDRTCEEWLYCRSAIATINQKGEKENMCFDIGLCNSVDEQGKCDNMPSVKLSKNGNQTYNTGAIEKFKNLSGFSKIGFDWTGQNGTEKKRIDGLYSIYQMAQTGNLAKVVNGDFESVSSGVHPKGWNQEEDIYETKQVNESLGWEASYFKIIDDPVEAADEGVCYKSITPCLAPEGKNFIKVNSVYRATSDFINVYPNTEYIISAHINSQMLSEGTAGIFIFEYGSQVEVGSIQGSGVLGAVGGPTDYLTKPNGVKIGIGQVSLNNESGYCIDSTLTSMIKGYKEDEIKDIRCETNYDCDVSITKRAGMICQTWDNIIPFLPSFTEAGQDWSFKISKFMTGDLTTRVKLKLLNYAAGEEETTTEEINKATGSSYFDDVQIRPALQTKDILDENEPAPECWKNVYEDGVGYGVCVDVDPKGDGKGKCSNPPGRDCQVPPVWHTTSSCRLYPETESLSCEYTDEEGAKHKGWRGYCLEYDKAPGNTDTCLLWWPADIIWGEYWGPDFGYNNRYPLYYCLAAEKSSPDGKCADNTISTVFARYPHLCPTKGAHDCAACALGEDGYTIVEFEDGITDKGNQTEWGTNPIESSRYDLSIVLGTRSGYDGIDVSVSNSPDGPWIPLGKAYGGYEFSMYQQNMPPDGCLNGTDEDCIEKAGNPIANPMNTIPKNMTRSCQAGGNCCKDGKECASNNWYTQWPADRMDGKTQQIIYPSNGKFSPSSGQNSLDRCSCVSVSEWAPKEDNYQEYISKLNYKFDFYGTDAEGGTFRYVKVDTIKAVKSDPPGRWDISSGPEIISIKAINSSPACLWISQVVTSESNQKAWLSRINQGNNYVARNKNGTDNWNADDYLVATHFYNDDWPPFGGIIPPEPVDNPTVWDSRKDIYYNYPLYAEAPDTTNYQTPYQARAGRPYSIERPGDMPSSAIKLTTPGNPSISELIAAGGAYVLKRLFAESYGTWQWSGTIGRCVGGEDSGKITSGTIVKTCEVDDCPGGSCLSSSRCSLKDARCEVDKCAGGGLCTPIQLKGGDAQEAKCDSGPDKGKNCCPTNWGVCGYLQSDNTYAGVCNVSRTSCQINCGAGVECDEITKTCESGPLQGKSCCPPVSTGFGGPFGSKTKPDQCIGVVISQCDGDPNGKTCSRDDCPSGTCEFVERRYYVSSKYLWGSPKTICPLNKDGKIERPDYDASSNKNNDYCGIPPRVGNIKVNGKQNEFESVILIKGGFATLTFTSHVDKDQLPIVSYKIDWGDGNVTASTGISINQNPSPDNPHTFYHYYNYWDILNLGNSVCGVCEKIADIDWCREENLTGINICEIEPRVQIRDNWNWCNKSVNNIDSGYYSSYCDTKSDAYTEFLGEIYIVEK